MLNDEDIFLKTLNKTYTTLKFLGDELKNNKEFIKKVVEKYVHGLSYMSNEIKNNNVIMYCGKELLDDYDIVIAIIRDTKYFKKWFLCMK